MALTLKVSPPGVDVKTAADKQLVINGSYPFLKLDTQNPVSFQTIVFTFNTDPPEPSGGNTTQNTTVYTIPHGYSYTPAFWSLVQTLVPPTGTHLSQTYFQSAGIIAAQTVDDSAGFLIEADSRNIYFIVQKFNDGAGSPNNLVGCVLRIRLYVFVDDLTA